MEYFEATDKLANLAGQHGKFEEARDHADRCAKNVVSPV
jgi:hypothetical protein